ncbi:MAG: RDD family protein [Bacteroidota bacterium]
MDDQLLDAAYSDEELTEEEVRQRIARDSKRVVNYLIDLVAYFVLVRLFSTYIITLLPEEAYRFYFGLTGRMFITYGLYYFIMELAFGRTFGKLVTKTRVVNRKGRRPSFLQVLFRTIFRFVPFDPFSFLTNPDGWHDRWSKTLVIEEAE